MDPNSWPGAWPWSWCCWRAAQARFRQAQRQNADWRVRHLRERAAAGQRLIAAQDEEREALARELHDALAPGLTALHLAWQGRAVRQALTQGPPALTEAHTHSAAPLRQLRHDVRALSHALLPTPPARPSPCPKPWPCSPKP
ncbi:MAG: histidine kinase [Hymenobacter sp.]